MFRVCLKVISSSVSCSIWRCVFVAASSFEPHSSGYALPISFSILHASCAGVSPFFRFKLRSSWSTAMASICGQKVHFVMSKGVSSLFEFVAAFSMVDSSCSTSSDFDASCSSSTRRVAFRRLV